MRSAHHLGPALFWALATLAPTSLFGTAGPVSRVTFELSAKGAPGPVQGSLTLRPVSVAGEPVVLPVEAGRAVSAELPARSSWELTAEVPGRWAARKILVAGDAGSEVRHTVVLWPLGKISGAVKVADPAGSIPRELTVKLQPPPLQQGEAPEGTVLCPVAEKGTWVCDLPAAPLDLSIRAEGFVPHYEWGVLVGPGKTVSLGTIPLRKGASLAGWAEREGGSPAGEKGTVKLVPLVAPGSNPLTAARVQSAAAQAAVDKRGFFQLGGLAPGSYLLEVAEPGFAPARVFPLEVWPGSETLLKQPIVLKRPLALEIAVSPPSDWLGQPWRARILRASEFSGRYDGEPAFDGSVPVSGRFRVPEQAPGTYSIMVTDSLGNRFFSDPYIQVRGPEDAEQSIAIDLVSVRGKILYGKEPLAATLHFGGTNGSVRSVMEADAEGEFDGVLPREGVWLVDVRAQEPLLETYAKVEVRADDRGRATLTITVPDTHLHGKVVDEEGRPVSKASVSLIFAEKSLDLSTEDSGRFEARGLPAGPVTLAADHFSTGTRSTSDSVFVTVLDGQPVGPVELRLQKSKSLKGRVESPRGPVAGAAVLLSSRWPLNPFGRMVHTGLDGSFNADIPGKTETVVAVVSAPGSALKAFEFPLDEIPVVLNVPQDGGALEVVLPYSADEIRDLGLRPSIFQNGAVLPGGELVKWARGHGESFNLPSGFRVPNLAPGDYRVCIAPRSAMPEWEAASWFDQQGQGACAAGSLAPGGTLRLEMARLPRPQSGE